MAHQFGQQSTGFQPDLTPSPVLRQPDQGGGFSLDKLGRAFSAFGAGVGGKGQEFIKTLSDDRKKALAQDALTVRNALESGDISRARGVLIDRIDTIGRIGGDARDSLGVLDQIDNGDLNGALNGVSTVVEFAQQEGILKTSQPRVFAPGSQVGRPGAEGSFGVPTTRQQDLAAGLTGADSFGRVIEGVDAEGNPVFFQAGTGEQSPRIIPDLVPPVSQAKVAFEAAQLEKADKKAAALEAKRQQAGLVTSDIQRALQQAEGSFTTGFTGSLTSSVPGTPAFDLNATLNGIKANVGFNKLQDMRENSPTGGALGQVSENENRLLQSVMGSVEQAQSQEQLTRNLDRLDVIFNAVIHGTAAIPFTQEQFDALPSGTRYIDPEDGNLYEKR